MREVSFITGFEVIEMFKTMRRLGMPPMRSFHIRSRMDAADIVGIGDNGVEAVRRLMESGYENAAYLVLHRDEKKLRQTKADTIAMKDGSWEGIETFVTVPFESLPKSFQKFHIYYNQTLEAGHPTFVLADFSEPCGRETAPAAARDFDLYSCRKIAVVHVPLLENLMAKKEAEGAESELCRSFRRLCRYTSTIIAMSDPMQEEAGAAKATAKRQSDFVGDLLGAVQGGANAALKWQETEAFLSGNVLMRKLWQAWSSEGADVRIALDEASQVLARGGVLQKAKQVFMITGKEGRVDLQDVQGAMDELTASLDEEADVMLHVNSEKKFDGGVRVNMAVRVEME